MRSMGAQRRITAGKAEELRQQALGNRDQHGGVQEKGRGHPDPPQYVGQSWLYVI